MTEVIQIPDQHHYLTKLLGYDYDIVYKSRRSNTRVNALSQKDSPGNYQLLIFSIPINEFLHLLSVENSSSLDLQEYTSNCLPLQMTINNSVALRNHFIATGNAQQHFTPSQSFQGRISQRPTGGHSGFQKQLVAAS